MRPASRWLTMNSAKDTDPNYSILNTLTSACKDEKGKFQFKLLWPKKKGNKHNIWKQSTNPITGKNTKVAGYEAVDVKLKENFKGLESGYLHGGANPRALLVGSVTDGKSSACGPCLLLPRSRTFPSSLPTTANVIHTVTEQWNYQVASTQAYNGGIHGASGNAETQVELYVMCEAGPDYVRVAVVRVCAMKSCAKLSRSRLFFYPHPPPKYIYIYIYTRPFDCINTKQQAPNGKVCE